MLFNLKAPSEVLGTITADVAKLTGLPADLPVFATSNDKAVEAFGAGLYRNGTVLISLGTYIAAMMQGTSNIQNTNNF